MFSSLGVGILWLLVMGATPSTKSSALVQTQRLEIVSGEGKLLASITGAGDSPQFNLYGKDGKPRIAMFIDPDLGWSHLIFSDENDKQHISLVVRPDGSSDLALLDKEGRGRIGLEVSPDDSARLGLFESSGKPRAILSADAEGTPQLGFWDEHGMPPAQPFTKFRWEPRN